MKYLKYYLIVFILLLCPNVFAATQNISNKIEAIPNFGGGTYYATAPVSVPVPLYQNIGTRYNGTLSYISFYLDNADWNWNYNKTYTITLNMATEDWRNHFMGPIVQQTNCDGSSQSSSSSSFVSNTFRFVSYKTIKFNFKLGSTMGCKTKFTIYSGNTSTTAFTGISNYNLSSISISDTTSAPTPTPVAPVPTATPSSGNQDIINNQNQNSQNIIDNQSQNTQDIINNNTQNTSDIIENNNQNTQNIIDNMSYDCENLMDLDELTLIKTDNRTYNYYLPNTLPAGTYTLSYNYNKIGLPTTYAQILINGSALKDILLNESGQNTFTVSNEFNRFYILISSDSPSGSIVNLTNFMLVQGEQAKPYCKYGTKVNKIDDTTNAINKQTDYLMDDSNPNIQDNEFTSLFDSVSFNDPLSYLLQLPVQLINTLINNSNTCTTINLGILYGTMLSLPCINIGNIIGSQVWDIIDVILSVSLLVVIFKNLYQTFANLITLGGEKEAREKFSMPTPMEFLSFILGGDR